MFTINTEHPFICCLDLARVCGLHMQGIQFKAVVHYCETLITQQMNATDVPLVKMNEKKDLHLTLSIR